MTTASGELAQPLLEALEVFAGSGRVLVALDFDGVLAPLVDDPMSAAPLPGSVAALQRLAGTSDVALVSGRALADLRLLSRAPAAAVLVGGHGTQCSLDGEDGGQVLTEAEARLLARVTAQLEEIAAAHEGVAVEHKPMSAVLHTRRADRAVAAEATRRAVDGPGSDPGVHCLRGKEVVEIAVVPLGKGAGLLRLRDRLAAAGPAVGAVLYAGDDVTDEDAFAALGEADVTVKVGPGETAARFRVADPQGMATLLTALADLRDAAAAR
ncbi:trehalose-phosphatase [Kineococcus glutinatus]|uniref:Trehalose 6-phosphate phosphatase n=1 Tax=Kineococcus glutinatus TaxID=1070872 RepID=A0ABP8VEB7_9ACTN